MALNSSNWIKICLNSSARNPESCSFISFWLFFLWVWTSLCPVRQVCRKFIFCSFGMFEFFLRSTLFCCSFEYCWFSYLGVHSDCTLSIWASPAKFKQFRPIYHFFKPEKLSQTQEIESWFSNLVTFFVVFFLQIKINSIYIHIDFVIYPNISSKCFCF